MFFGGGGDRGMGDFGGDDHKEFDEEFDTWDEDGQEVSKSGNGDNGNRPGVKVSGEKASGCEPVKSPEEIREEKKKRIIDGVIIKIIAEIKRREHAKKLAASDGEVTAETRPELFDKTGKKLTFGSSKSNPGIYTLMTRIFRARIIIF